ncbi:hypothetical protein [Lagierella sp.]|uniref:hypothetical protein n=1 Tax=Lagierella sp. TaxID=2849657 RepID=UPI0026172D65|nr:hypothetical protein [Lagierella sp.]
MKRNNFKYLVIMELKIMLKNVLFLIFGLFLPLFLLLIVGKNGLKGVPSEMLPEINTSLFIGFAIVIPFSAMHIGYAAIYAESLEKDIPLRMELFGNSPKKLFLAKLVANLIYITVAIVIYSTVALLNLEIVAPSLKGLIGSLILFYILSALFLLLAHGIAYATRKFGTTYAFTMTFYFFCMVVSGFMGIPKESLPKILNKIGELFLPMYHIQDENFVNFFIGKSSNLAPLIQSTITFGALVLLIFIGAHKFRERVGQFKKIG